MCTSLMKHLLLLACSVNLTMTLGVETYQIFEGNLKKVRNTITNIVMYTMGFTNLLQQRHNTTQTNSSQQCS